MRFEIKNVSTFRAYVIPGADGSPGILLYPGKTAYVTDMAKDMLVKAFNNGSEVIDWKPTGPTAGADPGIKGQPEPITGLPIVVIGVAPDDEAIGQKSVKVSNTTWSGQYLFDCGQYTRRMTIANTGSSDVKISFSGFAGGATEPPADKVLTIKGSSTEDLIFPEGNPERYFLYCTVGTATDITVTFE
jgi:hypothetical protein